jgi:hypothetical protein
MIKLPGIKMTLAWQECTSVLPSVMNRIAALFPHA